MNIQQEIEKGNALIQDLPNVLAYALIGSAMYMETAKDVDFAILVEADAIEYSETLHRMGWGNCGSYDTKDNIWSAIRKDNLNFMIISDKNYFDNYVKAMQVCKALNLQDKYDRIMVCGIVRDGMSADECLAYKNMFNQPELPISTPKITA